ncbi:MAG: putative membrane protein YfcA [Gammaproteobacteria bacterium]|jgi:uncharacterized membrane protein YfcA
MELLPAEISVWVAGGLVLLSFFTTFFAAVAGLGGGLIMIAVLASVLPAAAVIPVHGIIQVGANGGRTFVFRSFVNWPVVAWFSSGAVLGAWLGGSLLVALPTGILQLVIGLFVLFSVWGPKFNAQRIANPAFLPVGIGVTFLTMFVGATAPFVAAFISPDRFGREPTVATHAACMTVQHSCKVFVFGLLGFSYAPWLVLLSAMIVIGLLGSMVGRSVLMKLSQKTFKLIFNTVLTVVALRLLWSALVALL